MAGGFRVQLTGDWERLKHTVNYLNTRYRMDAILLNQDQAERATNAIFDKVWTLTGKPHGTGIWWYDTGELLENLEAKRVSIGDSAYFIGFKEGMHSHVGRYALSYNSLAEVLEAEHPLIAPTWQELEAEFLKEWQDLVLKATRGGA